MMNKKTKLEQLALFKVRRKVDPSDAFKWQLGLGHPAVVEVDAVGVIIRHGSRQVVRPGDWVVIEPNGVVTAHSDAEFKRRYEGT